MTKKTKTTKKTARFLKEPKRYRNENIYITKLNILS